MSGERVAICIPYYRSIEGPTLLSCMDLVNTSAHAGISLLPIGSSGAYIEDNRNECVRYAMNMDAKAQWTHLLWIDGDMIFPGDALVRLLKHDKDIVGAHYRTRTPPHAHAGVYEDRSGRQLKQPGLHKMIQMPTGLLLTKFDIYRKMEWPWFGHGLHGEARDDIYFCRKASSLGYSIWCDHDLTEEVQHITVQHIPWFTKEQLRPVEVRGAEINLDRSREEAKARAEISAEKVAPQSAA